MRIIIIPVLIKCLCQRIHIFNGLVTHSHKTCCKSPKHFLRYRPLNMSQINRKERNFQEQYQLFMGKTLSKYDKWYIILELWISAFSSSTNLKNLQRVLFEWVNVWQFCRRIQNYSGTLFPHHFTLKEFPVSVPQNIEGGYHVSDTGHAL